MFLEVLGLASDPSVSLSAASGNKNFWGGKGEERNRPRQFLAFSPLFLCLFFLGIVMLICCDQLLELEQFYSNSESCLLCLDSLEMDIFLKWMRIFH